jgi:hypothetical protein
MSNTKMRQKYLHFRYVKRRCIDDPISHYGRHLTDSEQKKKFKMNKKGSSTPIHECRQHKL